MHNRESSLARFVDELNFDDLNEDVVNQTKYLILDTLGCIIRGSREEAPRKIASLLKKYNGERLSSVIGFGFKTDPLRASIINGSSAHALELDDVYRPAAMHPAAVVIPTALSLGEALNSTSRDVITSIVAGYEICCRVGLALGRSHYNFWHTTATAGVFGSAATASKLLDLSPDQIVYSFGNAGTQAFGLWQFNLDGGMMSKCLHAGMAAHDGMLSALLSKEGFNGATRILEGEKGLLKATSKDYNMSILLHALGDGFEIMNTSIKRYPTCGHTHTAIDATLDLVQSHGINPEDVKEVLVETYSDAVDKAGEEMPRSPYKAKFSLKYCVAVSILDKKCSLEQFCQRKLKDNRIWKLADKISVSVNPKLNREYPEKWPAIVTIKTSRGVFSEKCEYPRGDPRNPIVESELTEKFIELTSPLLKRDKYRQIIKKVMNFEDLTSVGELMNELSFKLGM